MTRESWLKWVLGCFACWGCAGGPALGEPAASAGAGGASANAGASGLGGAQTAGATSAVAGSAQGGAQSGAGAGSVAWVLDQPSSVAGLVPQVWGAPTPAESPFGPALCFDGDDGLLLAANPIAGWPAFTVEVLFRPDAVQLGETALAEPRFLHIETDVADRLTIEARVDAYQFYLDTFISSAGAGKTLVDSTRTHPVNAWYWAALSYANGEMRHYVNGALDGMAAHPVAPLGAGKTSLGVRQNLKYWFRGCIREVRFSDRALEPTDLARLP